MSTHNLQGVKCPSCNTAGHTIPVWEQPSDYLDDKDPDYVGCTNCHTMSTASEKMIHD